MSMKKMHRSIKPRIYFLWRVFFISSLLKEISSGEGFTSISRVYPNVCIDKGKQYYDYENSPVLESPSLQRDINDYRIFSLIGVGKFGTVFEGVDLGGPIMSQKKACPPSEGAAYSEQSHQKGGTTSADSTASIQNPALYGEAVFLTTPGGTTSGEGSMSQDEGEEHEEQIVFRGKRVVLKKLQPTVKLHKIRREAHVLSLVKGGPHIINLQAIIKDSRTNTSCLVFDHLGAEAQWCCHTGGPKPLSDFEIRYYLFQLLRALEHCHSHGVMHRDVKPRNVMINPSNGQLHLIDFGLSEFYLPEERYSCRVASRHYKAPELLLGYKCYDYSLDMWGVGCMLAGLLFKKEPFFRGINDAEMVLSIMNVLGAEDILKFIKKYDLRGSLSHEVRQVLRAAALVKRQPLQALQTAENAHLIQADGLDLLRRLLRCEPAKRLTAREAMRHPYFDPVRIHFRSQYTKLETSQNIQSFDE